MSFSMYQASVPVLLQGLGSLSVILDKAAAHAETRKIEPAALLEARLFPDMFPFRCQVQLVSDFSKAAVARLSGMDVPKREDNEKSFEELRARLDWTVDFVKGFGPAQIDGSEEREIVIPRRDGALKLTGRQFLMHYALPQFWFHHTTAYALLRHNGVELGKRDFVGSF